jgi:hypothetical protein
MGNDMTLQELLEHGAQFVAYAFARAGSIAPMWVGELENGEHIPIQVPIINDETLAGTADVIRQIFQDNGVVRFVSMIEGWVVTDDGEPVTDEYKTGEKGARYHPDRKEAILLNASDGNEKLFGYFLIENDGDKPSLSPFRVVDEPPANKILNPFGDLLAHRKVTLQ